MGAPIPAGFQFPPPVGIVGIKRLYGDNQVVEMSGGNCKGDPKWESENLCVVPIFHGSPLKVQVHRLIVPLLQYCVAEAIARCPVYELRLVGGYCARHQFQDPRGPLSIHTWGAAVDFNWDSNPQRGQGDIPPSFVAAFTEQGWTWGGDFSTKDPMHLQFAMGA